VDLSGDKSRFFNMSYDHLVRRGMVEYYYINPGPTGVFPAMATGSFVSKLTAFIEGRHRGVNMDDESRRRVYAWIDSNIQYYSTWDMSRPYTCGGRDPWNFVKDDRRVTPEPEPWLEDLGRVYVRSCVSCHDASPFSEYMKAVACSNKPPLSLKRECRAMCGECPENYQINLTRPDFSRILNAHLSKDAGGLGIERRKRGELPPVFKDTDDQVYQEIYKAMVADERRTLLVLDDLLKALEAGRSPLLLTQRTEQLEIFARRLQGFARNVIVLQGGMGKRQRDEVARRMAAIPEGEERVLLATGPYIGEGFDDARLDTLFLAMPISWRGTLQQYVGRLHRLHEGKRVVQVYDYVDVHVPMLARMFRRRLEGYTAMGYGVPGSPPPGA